MALFHLNVSSIGKSSGSSAVASAAYRSCSQLIQTILDPNSGLEVSYLHDFSNKKGLVFSEIFAPEGVDSWVGNREELWNNVEKRETHVKARYARDIKLALQTEFSLEQNIQILSEYVKDVFVKDGIIADVNIHMDDPNNPHAHIMLTTRTLELNDNDEWVFGNKNRLLDSISWLVYIRNRWAEINNQYFMIHDIDKTITHESYETRGLDFIKATIHEGAAKHSEEVDKALERPEYNRNIVLENLQYIKSNPEQVIQALSKNASSLQGAFSRIDLFKAVDEFLNEIATRGDDYQVLIEEAKQAMVLKCDEIFKEINQLDLSLELDNHDGLINDQADNRTVHTTNSNYVNAIGSTGAVHNIQNTQLTKEHIIKENIIGLIEKFFANSKDNLNIDDELEFIKLNPAKLVEEINRSKAVFSKLDLAKVLDKHIDESILEEIGAENKNYELLETAKAKILAKYDELLVSLMNSNDIVKLVDSDLGGREVYTTKAQLNLEQEFMSNVEKLSQSAQHALNLDALSTETQKFKSKFTNSLANGLAKGLKDILTPEASSWLEKTFGFLFNNASNSNKTNNLTLSEEQCKAVLSLVNGNDIICLSGMPGTGKSTVMAKLVQEYINHGYEVVGSAISAVAALNLGTEAGISSYPLSKWKYDWDLRAELEAKGEEVRNLLPCLTKKTVMIIDEMSMVDLPMFNYIINKIVAVGGKVIPIGDNNQFSAIGMGGASTRIVERVENVALTELYRQRTDLDKEVTRKLGAYRVDEALILLDQMGKIKIGNSPEITRQELVNHYISQLHSNLGSDEGENSNQRNNNHEAHKINETRVIIAYRNAEVQGLNKEIRERLIASGLLHCKDYEARGSEFIGSRGKLLIAIGERIVFTKNHRHIGVLNGQIGKVSEIIDEYRFKVQLLGKANEKSKTIIINNNKFDAFDYGYAITAHKSQGKTYDHSYLLLDASIGYEAFNVMATRHRISSIFYIDRGVLNDIVVRKLENLKDVSHYSNKTEANNKAALFELLSRRQSNTLAHDYVDYDQKAEVIQIRAYIEYRDRAASVYRQLLDWQLDEAHQGKILKLWDNDKLWVEFQSLSKMRQQHAQELVEGYSSYQKYINSSIINYATLLKHADAAAIEFDYLASAKTLGQFSLVKEANFGYNELVALCQAYMDIKNTHGQKASEHELILLKTEELITIQQEYKCNLARLSSQIHHIENSKWVLESEKKASINYREDFKNYLNQIYKDGADSALNNWHELKQAMGIKKAIAHLDAHPESLGSLVGFGWSTKLAMSDKRAVALFNLRSLSTRLDGYEKAITQESQLHAAIENKERLELTPLRAGFIQLEASNSLSPLQEKYLYELQEHKEDLAIWLKRGGRNHIQEHIEQDTEYTNTKNRSKTQSNVNQSGLNKATKVTLENGIEKERIIENAIVEAKDYKHDKNDYTAKLSYAQIHEKLSDNIIELAHQLLPTMSNKKIEIDKHSIKCGSINIALDGSKRGLWYRFSRNDEKGDLFDLIRISQKLANKQASLEWGKVYLGLDRETNFANITQAQGKSSSSGINSNANINIRSNHDLNTTNTIIAQNKLVKTSLKVLSPVPQDAAIFNPEVVFSNQLNNKNGKNQVIEGIYAYKNIKNELCGYVVRIQDIETNTKIALPAVYTENNQGIRSWRSKGLGDDRCLYNEHRLFNSNKPVLIVEGEKTACAAQSLYPEFDVISWSGGANSFSKSNWKVLKDKQVTIWPDNDKAGIDAAHNIQALLDTQNITKAKVIDIKQIENLPEKWDLADNIPDAVRQHQITGALFGAKGIALSVRIDKTLNDCIEYRQNYFNEELNNKEIATFGEYLVEKETRKLQLHYEASLLKDQLQTQEVLTNVDMIFISLDAKRIQKANLATINLSPDSKLEIVSNLVQQDLAQLYHKVPKARLIEVTNAAMTHTAQIMEEHNKLQQTNETNNHAINDQIKKTSRLAQSDLSILALSLASSILNHHQNVESLEPHINANLNAATNTNASIYNQESHNDHSAMLNTQVHLQQAINMAKNSFKLRLEQDRINFEQHQQHQQTIQKQMSMHQGIEI
jgi:ATP-dependent exoDNAse (exonuclease V) alpha subunit